MPLKIDPNGLPADGLHLEGRLPASIFDLPADADMKAVSPLEYDLNAMRDEDDVIVTGHIAATFELECGRCAERFQYRVEEPGYVLDVPVENARAIDLTTWLREDILLALPTHPRCESGNVTQRQCPAEGRFDTATDLPRVEPLKEDRDVWKALDQLDNLKRN